MFYLCGLCVDVIFYFIVVDLWNKFLYYIFFCGEFVYYLKYDFMDSFMGLFCNYDCKNSFFICEVSGFIYYVELE